MSIKYNNTVSANSDGAKTVSTSWIDVGDNDLQIDKTIAGSLTDSALGVVFDGTTLQNILLVSNQDITLKINSTGSPFATIALKANVPYSWSAGGYTSNPLNVSVTEIYVTSTVAARLQGKVLTN